MLAISSSVCVRSSDVGSQSPHDSQKVSVLDIGLIPSKMSIASTFLTLGSNSRQAMGATRSEPQ
jgi:hypothetical protein